MAMVLGVVASACVVGGGAVGYQMMTNHTGACGPAQRSTMMQPCRSVVQSGPALDGNATTVVMGAGDVFQPGVLHVRTGQTVTWVNRDDEAHTVTSDLGARPLDSPLVQPGASWSFTFISAGTYAYHCTPHSSVDASGHYRGMTGEVVVE